MTAFTPDQWLILLLAFVLGLVLGMAFLASPKWKRRYREEVSAARGGRGRECAGCTPRDADARRDRARADARDDERRHDAGAGPTRPHRPDR